LAKSDEKETNELEMRVSEFSEDADEGFDIK